MSKLNNIFNFPSFEKPYFNFGFSSSGESFVNISTRGALSVKK